MPQPPVPFRRMSEQHWHQPPKKINKSINQSIIFISGQLRLFVRGDNLTDARYTITRGYRMPGIEVVS